MDLELFKEDEDVQVDMSPMIDMVFLLLIFFIVASIIVDEKVPVEVPSAVYAKVPEDITGRFVISVSKEGQIYVGQKPVDLEEMKEILRPEMEANPEMRIMIRADGDVRYKVNEEIMTACAEVGAVDLIYSAFEQ
jgi:biopolymer transport protein ExbD